jgi:hypothetical protein
LRLDVRLRYFYLTSSYDMNDPAVPANALQNDSPVSGEAAIHPEDCWSVTVKLSRNRLERNRS